ncbi:hypothetical protein GCM10022291_01110 [Postechiella marina]|uniref:Lipoprotein n=1 Tax=Postechiella marina TaxID=943941 RepID=A0ABP8BZ52_9FLAO
MTNKSLILIIVLLQVFLFGCKQKDAVCKQEISNFKLTNSKYLTNLDTINTVDSYKFRIHLKLNTTVIKNNTNTPCILSSKGIHTNIKELKITSNFKILNTEIGNPIDLNNFRIYACNLLVSNTYDDTTDSKNDRYKLNEWIDLLNTKNQEKGLKVSTDYYIEFIDKFQSAQNITFKFSLELVNGHVIDAETRPVNLI